MKTILKSTVLCLGLALGACAMQPIQTASLGAETPGSLALGSNTAIAETSFAFAQ